MCTHGTWWGDEEKNRKETLTSCSWLVRASAILKPPQRRSGRAHQPLAHALHPETEREAPPKCIHFSRIKDWTYQCASRWQFTLYRSPFTLITWFIQENDLARFIFTFHHKQSKICFIYAEQRPFENCSYIPFFNVCLLTDSSDILIFIYVSQSIYSFIIRLYFQFFAITKIQMHFLLFS